MEKKNKIWFCIISALLIFTINCTKDKKVEPTPTPTNTVTDIDGNVYHTVTIGTQIWLVENLKATKYRNGDAIPKVTNDSIWNQLTTGSYGNYSYNPINADTYGRVYNWYAVNDSRNICPVGWHIPTKTEWTDLWNYLHVGGAGGKMKETGLTHWTTPNTGATNESGFTGLPGGGWLYNGFAGIKTNGYWWTATEINSTGAYYWWLDYNDNLSSWNSSPKRNAFSVRCIKD